MIDVDTKLIQHGRPETSLVKRQAMSDDCCSDVQASCSPPPLILPERKVVATSPAESCADETCGCHGGVPVFDGMDPRYRRVLWAVIAINGTMFLTEMAAGQLAGSQAFSGRYSHLWIEPRRDRRVDSHAGDCRAV